MWSTQEFEQWWPKTGSLLKSSLSVWNAAFLSLLPTNPHPLPLLESSGAGLTRTVLQLAALACVQEHKACQWRTAVCQPFRAKRDGVLGVSQWAREFKPDSLEWRTALFKSQMVTPSLHSSALGARSCGKRRRDNSTSSLNSLFH